MTRQNFNMSEFFIWYEKDDKITYISTLKYKTNLENNGKILKCEVKHVAFDKQQLANQINIAKALLNIQFKPIILNVLHEKNMVSVRFKANPVPKSGFWLINNKTLLIGADLVNENQNNNTFISSEILEDNGNEFEYILNLTFHIEDENLARNLPISLEITNELGKTTYELSLIKQQTNAVLKIGIGIFSAVVIVILGSVLVVKYWKFLETIMGTARNWNWKFGTASSGSPHSGRVDAYVLNIQDRKTISRSSEPSINDVT